MALKRVQVKRDYSQTIAFVLIGLATIIVAVVGGTYAYFASQVEAEPQSIYVEAATPQGLIYNDDGLLALDDAVPGTRTEVKTFVVSNPDGNIASQIYSLVLHIDNNSFTKNHEMNPLNPDDTDDNPDATEQLVMHLGYGNCIINEDYREPLTCDHYYVMDLTDGDDERSADTSIPILEALIEPGETHYYYVYLEFIDTDANQDENKNASLGAHIELTDYFLIREENLPYHGLTSSTRYLMTGDFIREDVVEPGAYNYGDGSLNKTVLGYINRLYINGVKALDASNNYNYGNYNFDRRSSDSNSNYILNQINKHKDVYGEELITSGTKLYSLPFDATSEDMTCYVIIRGGGMTTNYSIGNIAFKVNNTLMSLEELVNAEIIKPIVLINGSGQGTFNTFTDILNIYDDKTYITSPKSFVDQDMLFMLNKGNVITDMQIYASRDFNSYYDGLRYSMTPTRRLRLTLDS